MDEQATLTPTEPTDAEALQFAAFAMMCRMFTECVPYRATPASAKATRAELHRQGLPIPGRGMR